MTEPAGVEQLLHRHFGATSVIRRRVNPNNPENLSFAVDAEAKRLWVKVVPDSGPDAGLDRWASATTWLEERYCAPAVLERIMVMHRVALVFPRLDLPPADTAYLRQNGASLLSLLDRLHHDGDLGSALTTNRPVTAGEVFRKTWVRRFTEDLAIIRDRVPFVDEKLFRWMRTETAELELSTRSPDFDVVVRAPAHGDLWTENILVDVDRYWILDWDDLAIGDPVVDDAVLLFNLYGGDLDRWSADRPPLDPSERHRFEEAARTQLLDLVIDTLADWVELPVDTADIEQVRSDKEAVHRSALADYRDRYVITETR